MLFLHFLERLQKAETDTREELVYGQTFGTFRILRSNAAPSMSAYIEGQHDT
jgi:hypothetical protein